MSKQQTGESFQTSVDGRYRQETTGYGAPQKYNYSYDRRNAREVTELQESLFAVGYSISQTHNCDLTSSLLLDRGTFITSGKQYKEPIDLGRVHYFAQNESSWVKSVVDGVNVLKRHKLTSRKDYNIFRGGGVISDIYEMKTALMAIEGEKLNDDKWNPADIWLVAPNLRVLPKFESLPDLNTYIRNSIERGTLLPISLKKSTKDTKVTYVFQGGGASTESFTYCGVRAPDPDKNGPFNTGVMVKTSDKTVCINTRSSVIKSTSIITSELILDGSEGRGGKASPSDLIKEYKIPQTTLGHFRRTRHLTGMWKQQIIDLWGELGHNFDQETIERGWNERLQDIKNPAGYFRSIINSLELSVFMNNNPEIADHIVSETVGTAFSTTPFSSDHLKVS